MFKNLKTTTDYIAFGRKTALITFLLATAIVYLYYFTMYSGVIYISLFFMISFFLLNSVLFVKLLIFFLKDVEEQKAISLTLLIMLLNIPIGYLYLQIGFSIYGLLNI
jgi:hypothetical protein